MSAETSRVFLRLAFVAGSRDKNEQHAYRDKHDRRQQPNGPRHRSYDAGNRWDISPRGEKQHNPGSVNPKHSSKYRIIANLASGTLRVKVRQA